MSSNPVVSIIVPVYNTLPYLGTCMDSLLSQTLEDIEVICIDDGSTDGSSDLLDEYSSKDSRITVVHQENAGVSSARNAGLQLARGSFVLFVDSDDFIEPSACEKLSNVARRDNSDIVIFGGETFPSIAWIDQCMSSIDATFHEGGVYALFNARGAYPLMCNKLYRRTLLLKNGLFFETSLSLGEDHAFQFCTFPHAKTVSSIRDHIYHYRCGRTGSALSISESQLLMKAERHFDMVEYVLSRWQGNNLINNNAADLLAWLTDFLLSSVRQLCLDDRISFGKRYTQLICDYGLNDSVAASPSSLSRHNSLAVNPDDNPIVSAIVLTEGQPNAEKRCILSLLEQELPQLEVIAIGSQEDELPSALQDERRFHTADGFAQSVDMARGDYILFADATDYYEPYALRIMTDLANQEPKADVITIQDRGNSLRVADLSAYLHSLSNNGTVREPDHLRTWLSSEELNATPPELFSLDPSNKLWKREFARRHFDDSPGEYEVGIALSSVRTVCPISEPYFEKGIYRFLSTDDAVNMASRQVDAIERLTDSGLESDSAYGVAVSLCMGTSERIADADAAACYLDSFCSLACKAGILSDDSAYWPTNLDDYEAVRTICKHGASEYLGIRGERRYELHYQSLAEHRSRHSEYLRAASLENEWRMQALESVSFRIGRAITQAPRKLRDAIKARTHRG